MEDTHHIEEKLVTIAEYENDFNAEMARSALEDEGIRAMVLGGDLVANMPTIEPIRIQLQVLEEDVAKAKEVLEDLGYDNIKADNADSYDFEKTLVQIKESKKEYLSLLESDLKDHYSLETDESYLEKDSKYNRNENH